MTERNKKMTEKDNSLLNSVLNFAKKAMAEASKADGDDSDAPKAGLKSDNPLELLKMAKNLLEDDDAEKALGLLKKAAEGGIPEAKKNFAELYKYGMDHKEDIAKIIGKVKQAALTMQAMADNKPEDK